MQVCYYSGKLLLELEHAGSSFNALDFGHMACKLICVIEEKLIDKNIRNWLIPDFTTTTDNDIVIASMTMMATFKDYFDYRGRTGCGFPSVTLLGEEEDWKNMRRRLGLLTSGSYGERLTTWSKLLVPMLD
jgi:hypothetical protein